MADIIADDYYFAEALSNVTDLKTRPSGNLQNNVFASVNEVGYFWKTNSVDVPNGITVVVPNDITPPAPGRWLSLDFQKTTTSSIINPTITDDYSLGFRIGDFWLNTATKIAWMCTDNTIGAADWVTINDVALWGDNGVVTKLVTPRTIDAQSEKVINVLDPTANLDAVNLQTLNNIVKGNYVWDGADAFSDFYAEHNISSLDYLVSVSLTGAGHVIDAVGSPYANLKNIQFVSGSTIKTITIADSVTMDSLPNLYHNVALTSDSSSYISVNPTNAIWRLGVGCSFHVNAGKLGISQTAVTAHLITLYSSGFGSFNENTLDLGTTGAAIILISDPEGATNLNPTSIYGSGTSNLTVFCNADAILPTSSSFTNFSGSISISYLNSSTTSKWNLIGDTYSPKDLTKHVGIGIAAANCRLHLHDSSNAICFQLTTSITGTAWDKGFRAGIQSDNKGFISSQYDLQFRTGAPLEYRGRIDDVTGEIVWAYNIQAPVFVSTIADGTAPLQITSTTKVLNLNVDSVDGYDFNQSLQTTSSPIFNGISLSGSALPGGILQTSISGAVSSSVILPDGTKATTQSAGDNSTKVATTAYVDAAAITQHWNLALNVLSPAVLINKVAIGITTANEKLQIHDVAAVDSLIQLTNLTTGFGASNGVKLGVKANGEGLLQSENLLDIVVNGLSRSTIDSAGLYTHKYNAAINGDLTVNGKIDMIGQNKEFSLIDTNAIEKSYVLSIEESPVIGTGAIIQPGTVFNLNVDIGAQQGYVFKSNGVRLFQIDNLGNQMLTPGATWGCNVIQDLSGNLVNAEINHSAHGIKITEGSNTTVSYYISRQDQALQLTLSKYLDISNINSGGGPDISLRLLKYTKSIMQPNSYVSATTPPEGEVDTYIPAYYGYLKVLNDIGTLASGRQVANAEVREYLVSQLHGTLPFNFTTAALKNTANKINIYFEEQAAVGTYHLKFKNKTGSDIKIIFNCEAFTFQ